MKTNIDANCKEVYEKLKFNKQGRYIIYKVENETVVSILLSSPLKQSDKGKKDGQNFSRYCQPKNPECVSST